MASERVGSLPEELDQWLAEQVESGEHSREELLALAVDLYRFLEENEDVVGESLDGQGLSPLEDRIETLNDRVGDLDERVTALGDLEEEVTNLAQEVDDDIEDVRERLIQIKREIDEKAPDEHEHENLTERVNRAGKTAVSAQDRLDEVEDQLDRIDEGFENYEEVLDYLTETTDDLERKLDILAGATIDHRQRLAELERAVSEQRATGEIKREANREGIATASCENCESSVRIGQLSQPRCPHCNSPFDRVEPASSRFFGSPRLRTGTPPALEGEEEPVPESPDGLFEEADDE